MNIKTLILNTLVACSIGTLAACSSSSDSTPASSTSISGSIFAAPVNGAGVSVKDMNGNTIAGPATTAADGSYTIDIPDNALSSDLVFESTGGIFDDEETGASGVGTAAGALSAFVAGGSLALGDSVHVTPGTTIHAGLVTEHGKTDTEAETACFNAFAYHPDISVQPVDITDPAALTASDASRHIGFRAAVFSRLAQDIGLTADQQFDMFAALAQDLSDDTLDGVDANGTVSIGNTGTSLPANIGDQYITTVGSFTDAETASYQVTYTPPMMNVHGKNTFTLTITDTAGAPVTGLLSSDSLSVMPMMHMAEMMHSTPLGGITESAPGVYDVTIYYLMPSRMMDGTTMGTWDLKVMIGMETAHFYPNIEVAMMNNTVRVQLKGVDDTIIDMNGLEVPRTYNLFKDNLTIAVGGNDQFDIFIAPIETMLSFPALLDPMTLMSGMGGTPYDVSGVTVDVNVNDTGWMTNKDTDNGDGTWSLSGLILNSGENTIKVRLTVSGETKTTNGLPADADVNDFATFTVTVPVP